MTTDTLAPETADLGRTKRLKARTGATHDRLDAGIMSRAPFSSRERYGLFLRVQHGFHRQIDALYADPTLDSLLPDLAGRRRLHLIAQDLADLGLAPPPVVGAPLFTPGGAVDLPTALGWLYVAEGSNLGAAFLLKAAASLGLNETFGAHHLAPAPEGRGLHWKTFTAALDALELSPEEDARMMAGGEAAFRHVHALVERGFDAPPAV
ncbi:heme oxygenase [Azorhizobium oxalatiphilum]|uniref:Heme oxygenase n=1 Tax=Azorhizobium oxalatiphilum TaxID=980631 RepID=A0A917C0E8_9HYPH|nr:biliverdin-producing heme oxygenase [Azorhizobium oxalatiphilum]GGF63842.1 heme oxygenase [Azorhizobium oxalatiphilum]